MDKLRSRGRGNVMVTADAHQHLTDLAWYQRTTIGGLMERLIEAEWERVGEEAQAARQEQAKSA